MRNSPKGLTGYKKVIMPPNENAGSLPVNPNQTHCRRVLPGGNFRDDAPSRNGTRPR